MACGCCLRYPNGRLVFFGHGPLLAGLTGSQKANRRHFGGSPKARHTQMSSSKRSNTQVTHIQLATWKAESLSNFSRTEHFVHKSAQPSNFVRQPQEDLGGGKTRIFGRFLETRRLTVTRDPSRKAFAASLLPFRKPLPLDIVIWVFFLRFFSSGERRLRVVASRLPRCNSHPICLVRQLPPLVEFSTVSSRGRDIFAVRNLQEMGKFTARAPAADVAGFPSNPSWHTIKPPKKNPKTPQGWQYHKYPKNPREDDASEATFGHFCWTGGSRAETRRELPGDSGHAFRWLGQTPSLAQLPSGARIFGKGSPLNSTYKKRVPVCSHGHWASELGVDMFLSPLVEGPS